MGLLNYTTRANLVANTPENIADVTDCLDKIRTSVNSVAEEQLEAGAVTATALASGAVTAAKLAADAKIVTGSATLASDFNPTSSYTDVTGVTASFTPTVASVLIAVGTFTAAMISNGAQTTASAYVDMYFDLDGSLSGVAGHARYAQNTTSITLGSGSQVTILTITPVSAAAHTLKVKAKATTTNALAQIVAKGDSSNASSGFRYFLLPA